MQVAKIIMINAQRPYYESDPDLLHELISKLRETIPYDKNDRVEIIEMTEEEYLQSI